MIPLIDVEFQSLYFSLVFRKKNHSHPSEEENGDQFKKRANHGNQWKSHVGSNTPINYFVEKRDPKY